MQSTSSDKATTVDAHNRIIAQVIEKIDELTNLSKEELMPSLNLSEEIRSTQAWKDAHSRFIGNYGSEAGTWADLAIWRRSLGLWSNGSANIHAIQHEPDATISTVVGEFLDTFGQANASEEVKKTRTKVLYALIDAALHVVFNPETYAPSSSPTLKRAGSPNSSSPSKHPRI